MHSNAVVSSCSPHSPRAYSAPPFLESEAPVHVRLSGHVHDLVRGQVLSPGDGDPGDHHEL